MKIIFQSIILNLQKDFGKKHPVPIEVEKEKIDVVQEEVKKLGANKVEIRKSNTNEGYLITDNGNYILHAWFDKIDVNLEEKLIQIDGVLESGLFIGYDIIVIKQEEAVSIETAFISCFHINH